jgi:PKD domain
MARGYRGFRWFLPATVLLLWSENVSALLACSIDGVPSLSANNALSWQNVSQATAANQAYWAPFILPDAAPGDTLWFSENLANVALSIPSASLLTPFKWSFGDGATAMGQVSSRGQTITHRYTKPGWYRIVVKYYWQSHRQWIEFDSAVQHIALPSNIFASVRAAHVGGGAPDVRGAVGWAALIAILPLMLLETLRPNTLRRAVLRCRWW